MKSVASTTPFQALCGALIVAAGCGDNSTSANTANTAAPNTTAPTTMMTTTTPTGGGGSSTGTAGSGGSQGGSSGAGGSVSEGGMSGTSIGGAGAGGASGSGGMDATAGDGGEGGAAGQKSELSFFITSSNPDEMGGNLGGLTGADAFCQALAEAVEAGDREWRAYLSTDAEDARDRIGAGPWTNANGVVVATSVENLHSDDNMLSKENSVTEEGEVVNGAGDDPNRHDILTGSNLDGTAADATCDNWTSNAGNVNGRVGHHDRQGGGQNPTSWNSAHDSNGCSIEDLRGTGGDGRFYCFAADPPSP